MKMLLTEANTAISLKIRPPSLSGLSNRPHSSPRAPPPSPQDVTFPGMSSIPTAAAAAADAAVGLRGGEEEGAK